MEVDQVSEALLAELEMAEELSKVDGVRVTSFELADNGLLDQHVELKSFVEVDAIVHDR